MKKLHLTIDRGIIKQGQHIDHETEVYLPCIKSPCQLIPIIWKNVSLNTQERDLFDSRSLRESIQKENQFESITHVRNICQMGPIRAWHW